MGAEESLREGDLAGARAQLTELVKKDPSNAKYRVFLFQLLSVFGEWDRALTQLNVSGELDAGNLAMVQTYREAIQCEVFREEVFGGKRSPLVFGEPEQWVALMIEAARLSSEGHFDESQDLRGQALESAPTVPGTVNGEPFDWLADADTRLGPILEAVINGKYYWVPLHRVKEMVVEEPNDLRDVVWAPAHLRWTNGGDIVALLPSRYPGSYASEDPLIRLGRKTEWIEKDAEVFLGQGQKLLATNVKDFALLEVRSIVFDTGEEAAADAPLEDAGAGEEGSAG